MPDATGEIGTDRPALEITDDEMTALARVLFEEEDRMRPELDGRAWPDLDPGEEAFYRNAAKAVLRAATNLRIRP